jgi:glycosyltransferase involved in cell wall biosynthesis
MTICFFGNYIKDYPRVAVIRRGLIENGVEVLECHTRETGIKKYISLWRQHKQVKNKYDLLLVMMGGQTLVWFAKILTKKKVVFDAFSSLYLTNIEDRQLASKNGFKAQIWAFWDYFSCHLADKVLLDTYAQIDYFVNRYRIKKEKFIRMLVGADNEFFYHNSRFIIHNSKFIIHWHGYIVPFYGMKTIIKSAEILKNENIEFRIITRFNEKYEKIKKMADSLNLNNVKFFPETNREAITKSINESDVCLGIFGNNEKARVVIPNKIYEAIACAKPVITGRQRVLNELFEDNENIIMSEPENSTDLAEKILDLKNNKELREKIGKNANNLFLEKLKSDILVKELLNKL